MHRIKVKKMKKNLRRFFFHEIEYSGACTLYGSLFVFCYISGPKMPRSITNQGAVEIGGDLYTIGGLSSDGSGFQTEIQRLS